MRGEKILTINLSEQALDDLLIAFDLTEEAINPNFHRTKKIMEMYDRLIEAKYQKKEKVNFLYEK